MGEIVAKAYLGCDINKPQSVIDRGVKVDEGIFGHSLIYVTPTVVKVDYEAQLLRAQTKQGLVKNGSVQDTIDRDVEVKGLYGMLDNKLLPYTNGLFKGNKQNLAISGFPVWDHNTPHGVQEAPLIKKIVAGPVANSVKIMLAKTTSPLLMKKEKLLYFVYVSDSADGPEIKLIFKGTNSRKLIVLNVQMGIYLWYSVTVLNSAGESLPSTRERFNLT